ncbi:uncharacterized protein LOC116667777 isoform X4 [Camelus ferus]|uniref:Uncharacterized protein LOC116667777 isoform X4 n=2 Tax=Camelus TaxID=9836 RepID=A0A8B8U670_CAMFR|nr:uncharacterized protein LOC116667777 isoform X4 [Camelus ferus]
MATYPPRRLLGARPLPSDLRRDPRRSGFPQGGGGRWERRLPTGQSLGPGNLRYWCTHFQGPAARQHHLLRIAFKIFLSSLFCSFTLCVQPFPLRIYKEEIVKEIKEEEKLSQITRIQEGPSLGGTYPGDSLETWDVTILLCSRFSCNILNGAPQVVVLLTEWWSGAWIL